MEQLTGSWQPSPLLLAGRALSEIDGQCRADPEWPGDLPLVVWDARGAGMVLLQYAGADGTEVYCEATIERTGQTRASISVTIDPHVVVPMEGDELSVSMGTGQTADRVGVANAHWALTGRAGAQIAQVIVDVAGVPPVAATSVSGRFAVWWPGSGERYRLLALDASGAQIGELGSE